MKTKANKFRETIQRLNITAVIILAMGSGDGVVKAPIPTSLPSEQRLWAGRRDAAEQTWMPSCHQCHRADIKQTPACVCWDCGRFSEPGKRKERNGSLGWLEKGTVRWSLPRSEGPERVHSQSSFVGM